MNSESHLSQWILDLLVRLTSQSPTSLRRRAVSLVRKIMLVTRDTTVRIRFAEASLSIPFSHDLPVYAASYPRYSLNLGAVAKAVNREHPDGSIIDIGANIGDSLAIIRSASAAPVLCIEGDSTFLPYLQKNAIQFGGVEIDTSFVATSQTEPSIVVRGSGTARLATAPIGQRGVPTTGIEDILARHPNLPPPALIKIDTDGQDANILLTAESLLGEHHPVLFFEWDPRLMAKAGGTSSKGLFDFLHRMGYRLLILCTNTGERMCSVNIMDWPTIADLEWYLTSGTSVAYFDICALSERDHGIASALRSSDGQRPPEGATPVFPNH